MGALALTLTLMVLTTLPTHGSPSLLTRASRILSDLHLPERLNQVVWCTPPRVDWKETPELHALTIELPGLDRNQIKIEVLQENKTLRVSGESKKVEEEDRNGNTWHRTERCYGKFTREFTLPENVDLDSVRANLEKGVLGVYLVKLSPDKIVGPKKVTIQSNEKVKNQEM